MLTIEVLFEGLCPFKRKKAANLKKGPSFSNLDWQLPLVINMHKRGYDGMLY